jgi:uncharacterized protein
MTAVYGMCGLVAFLFWKLRPGWLLALGLLSLAVCSMLWLLTGWSIQFWPPEQVSAFVADQHPGAEAVAREVAIYQGGWLEQMTHRVPYFLEFQTMVFFFWGGWRAGGLMLVGMALFKLGVFSARLSRGFYLGMAAVGIVVGIPIVLYGVYRDVAAEWDPTYSFFLGTQFNYWASILVSLGWVGIVMLACRAGRPRFLLDRLAAAGRMAFSLYILQTLICTTMFYGHGFGLFGRVERVGQIAIVAGIVVLQLWIAPLWLRRFRFGPLEWLWRTLTYRRLQPMRNA